MQPRHFWSAYTTASSDYVTSEPRGSVNRRASHRRLPDHAKPRPAGLPYRGPLHKPRCPPRGRCPISKGQRDAVLREVPSAGQRVRVWGWRRGIVCSESRTKPEVSVCGVAARRARAGGWGDNSVLGMLPRRVEGSTAESTHNIIILRRAHILHPILNTSITSSDVSHFLKVQQPRIRTSGRFLVSIFLAPLPFARVLYFDGERCL